MSENKYYIKAHFIANYYGNNPINDNMVAGQLHNVVFTDVKLQDIQPITEYNVNRLTLGDDYLVNLAFDNALIQLPNSQSYVKAKVKNAVLLQPKIVLQFNKNNETHGTVEGVLYGEVERNAKTNITEETKTTVEKTEEIAIQETVNKSTDIAGSYKNNVSKKWFSWLSFNWFSGSIFSIFRNIAKSIKWLFYIFIGIPIVVFIGYSLLHSASLHLFFCGVLVAFIIMLFSSGLARILRQIRNIFSFIFLAILCLLMLAFLYGYINQKNKQKESIVQQKDEPNETSRLIKNASLAKFENDNCLNNPIVAEHYRLWQSLDNSKQEGVIYMSQCNYFSSRENREGLKILENDVNKYQKIYQGLATDGLHKLGLIYQLFDSIRKTNRLNEVAFANMIVSCVQDIPYRLVIEDNRDLDGDLLELYKREGALEHIRFGVQAPAEFMFNLQGDCDTRALFCYTVLAHYGYKTAILISEKYSHAVLGLALPCTGSNINYRGYTYYAWETTAKGYMLGQLSPECNNMNFWRVGINN